MKTIIVLNFFCPFLSSNRSVPIVWLLVLNKHWVLEQYWVFRVVASYQTFFLKLHVNLMIFNCFFFFIHLNLNLFFNCIFVYIIMHFPFSAQGLFFLSGACIRGSFFSFSSTYSLIAAMLLDSGQRSIEAWYFMFSICFFSASLPDGLR